MSTAQRQIAACGVLLLAALALIAFAPHANAATRHHKHHHHKHTAAHRPKPLTVNDKLNIALRHAHDLWGTEPCNGHYRVEMHAHLPAGIGGEAVWNSPTGHNYGSPPSTWTECVLRLGPEITFQWQDGLDNWTTECVIVMHEYGHLTGHAHSDENEPNAPGVPADTPEQANIMLSGQSFGATPEPDLSRCGWEAH